MGTTITPLPSGGPDDEGHLIFLGDGKSPVSRFLEAKKNPKKIFAEAEGVMSPRRSKAKKITKPSKGKNLRASDSSIKSKKRGIFGETYKPVAAGNKGVRVAESRRFRESVSSEDLRSMLQRALRVKFPLPPYIPGGGPVAESSGFNNPYIKDVFPDEKLVVFTMGEVTWGANYVVDENAGKAHLKNIRRVKVKYVGVDEDGVDTKESADLEEAAPKGWGGTVKHMKKHKDIENPFALAHWMKGEGYQPHH